MMNDVSRNPKTREVQALSVIFLVSDSLSVTQHPLSSPSRRKLIVTEGMSPWTKVLNGGNREDTTPLLPDSDPPDLHRERDSSAPVAASSSPVDEYPDPVKPGREPQHASHHGYPAIGVEAPPVHASGDFVTGHPVLPQATEPPAGGHSQLVTNERRIVQQPMKGNAVIVSCHQCGHVGPALVTKESGFVTYFSSGMLCFLGCCPLFLFPFCCDYTKDWVYRCSNCSTLFGRERP